MTRTTPSSMSSSSTSSSRSTRGQCPRLPNYKEESMRADQVIELRKRWQEWSFGSALPAPTVLATEDWLAYVQAMSGAIPRGERIDYPSEKDVLWAWPDGVVIVFAEPFEVSHTIISKGVPSTFGGERIEKVEPHYEHQLAAGLAILPLQPTPAEMGGERIDAIPAFPLIWIGADPSDLISGHWLPGSMTHAQHETGEISESTRLLISLVTALGHRLTRLDEADTISQGRGERRRVQRELPDLRVLRLGTGASVTHAEGTGTIEWTKRWMV